ncbi:metallophosphoesterase [Arenibacter troitsensis]|uniref:3',5'-cyclic AMP phosphodiesterase CpdA n=1 Tax=Arenibacter troitsensis TaxID=188872 RepID=A0A1X7JJA7_9FLAO|nr:metallophosphoesterase [Arenibacter troitsensis]SMG27376.1 3',5'-cyclic AMP phosphodiesterase CpdA [Arenibacter troitsensis]
MKIFIRYIVFGILTIILAGCQSDDINFDPTVDLAIGIIADCQYCECESYKSRYYKYSLSKLEGAIEQFNTEPLNYTIHLGDFIDRDFASFDKILPVWNKLSSKKYHVLGNHDFNVADAFKPKVLERLDLVDRYYSIVENQWRFIVLDGNDLSYHGAYSQHKKKQTDSLFSKVLQSKAHNKPAWNGGISQEQLVWLENELISAHNNDERVGIYCHFPIAGNEYTEILWNSEQILDLIDKYPAVKFYFNGHNHDGDYLIRNGVHYLTFKGMVESDSQSPFASVFIIKNIIYIEGHGGEHSRKLIIK